uniref:Uncharacterized protein n=1 Tax=Arundo donax TaxID=35708 RepID=A0A0A9G3Z9_ARUDO
MGKEDKYDYMNSCKREILLEVF